MRPGHRHAWHRVLAVLLLGGGCILYPLRVRGGEEVETPVEQPAFNLGFPEITKLSWNVRSLLAHDLDHDGRTDLLVINNDRARLELLYQRRPGERDRKRRSISHDRWEPLLEDARFRKESIPTGIRMFDLSAGDLDGDGRTDLVYTGSPDALTIRYQKRADDFKTSRVLDIDDPVGWAGSTCIADLDGDGRADLAVLTESQLLVFTQSRKGELEGPRLYALSADDSFGLRALDVDRDGRVDLLYQVANTTDALRLRFGQQQGGFGPELAFRLEALRGLVVPIRLESETMSGFVTVQQRTGLLSVVSLGLAQEGEKGLLKQVMPRRFATQVDPKNPPAYAVADVDGDGRLDIVLADPKGARLWLHRQEANGIFVEPQSFPCLSGVRALAAGDGDGDGRAELFLTSPGERSVAVTTLSEEGRMTYPRPLVTGITGKPYGLVAADVDGDGSLEVAFTHEDKQDRGVTVMRRTADGTWQTTTIALPSLKTTPRGLQAFDADQDGRLDLAVFAAHEPVLLLLQDAAGRFTEAQAGEGFRKGLVSGVEEVALTTGDVTGNGRDEILVASAGYARSLRVADDGGLQVVDQYNAREADTKLAATAVIDLDGDDRPEVVLISEDGEQLEVLARHRDGVYRFREAVAADGMALVGSMVVDLDGNGRSDLLLLGKRRFSWWPVGGRDRQFRVAATYESDLKDVEYHLIGVGDLDSDGSQEIVAVDSRGTRIMEILTNNGDAAWRSAMHFTIFEVDPHYEGQRGNPSEPREMVITDLTGDGKDDIALLIHDRVLVYPQL